MLDDDRRNEWYYMDPQVRTSLVTLPFKYLFPTPSHPLLLLVAYATA